MSSRFVTQQDVLLGSPVVIDFQKIGSVEDFYIDQCFAHNTQIVESDAYTEEGCPYRSRATHFSL